MKNKAVSCTLCGKTWPRDPVLEVPCSKCGAEVGRKCGAFRPSDHKLSAGFAGLPSWGHAERDLAADAAGKYGECEFGRCSNHPKWSEVAA